LAFISVTLMAVLSTTTVEAATLGMYTPGGAPCDGACSYEWAVEEFNVPEGEPERMMVEAGHIVMKMSYAEDGVPYTHENSAILASDQYGEGYWFEEDGRRMLMFRLDECQNWAVLVPPVGPLPGAAGPARPESPPIFATLLPPVIWTSCCDIPSDPPIVFDPPSDPPIVFDPPVGDPPPPVIPLPASFWLLLAGLTLLYARSRA